MINILFCYFFRFVFVLFFLSFVLFFNRIVHLFKYTYHLISGATIPKYVKLVVLLLIVTYVILDVKTKRSRKTNTINLKYGSVQGELKPHLRKVVVTTHQNFPGPL